MIKWQDISAFVERGVEIWPDISASAEKGDRMWLEISAFVEKDDTRMAKYVSVGGEG